MDKKQITISALLSIASVIASCGFVLYGAGIAFAKDMEVWLVAMGMVIAVYGLVSLVVLLVAWRQDQRKMSRVMFYIATGFLLLLSLGSFDMGMISGLEFGFLFGVAVLLAINWAAVSVVARYRSVT